MSRYIYPISDFFIRYLLGSEHSEAVLIDFVNTILFDATPGFNPISEINVLNPFNLASVKNEKETVLDVKARDQAKRTYNVEIQVLRQKDFGERTLYYWSRLYSGQLQRGDEFTKLNPVICINLLDFKLFDELEWAHNHFLLLDDRTRSVVLSKNLEIHFIELPKVDVRQGGEIHSRLEKWAFFLKNEGKMEEEEFKRLIVEGDSVMEQAHEAYKRFASDDELSDAYEAREKYLRDKHAQIEYAREVGREEGREEERIKNDKKNLENAIIMRNKGISYEIIYEVTGISEEQLESGEDQ